MNQRQTATYRITSPLRSLGRALGLLPQPAMLPRRHSHFITLPLRGVPKRHIADAIRLQLQQLGIFSQPGFAWKLTGDEAQIWYWDEAVAARIIPPGRWQPWPEPLWRKSLPEGARLLTCGEGFELEGCNSKGSYRSRWFATTPETSDWCIFCQDLGLQDSSLPAPITPTKEAGPIAGWQIHSELAPPLPTTVVAALTLILAGGVMAAVLLTQSTRIEQLLLQQKLQLKALKQQGKIITELERELATQMPLNNAIAELASSPKQIALLAGLFKRGIIGERADAWLAGWGFQNDVVTLTLSLGNTAKRSELLARLERAPQISELTLMPDPPPGTMVVRLRLSAMANQAESEPTGHPGE